ncbi:hypothetical protein [Paenibacillus dokdonensis]|uniref:hypothetical protein n=1 Tax=Paenibacillus dokdonensis TaxID=2567944 RepID=UPI0010A81D61|nr:hypothetical protein [Paenibacillus dokdonensis]
MNTWIFAGLCDKSEILMYLCKMLVSSNYSVLLVDATEKRKYPFYIGQLDEQLSITEFAGFDVACGFDDVVSLDAHLQITSSSLDNYDYVIYDLEHPDFCTPRVWREASALVWVTDYEIWTLEKGSMWLHEAVKRNFAEGTEPEMFKLIVRAVDEWYATSYLDGYFNHLPVCWKEEPIVIPWNELDLSLKLRNEHTKRVQMKPLTRGFKRNLCQLVQMITEWDQKKINRALRVAERRKA